jgi:hypothetical protein
LNNGFIEGCYERPTTPATVMYSVQIETDSVSTGTN